MLPNGTGASPALTARCARDRAGHEPQRAAAAAPSSRRISSFPSCLVAGPGTYSVRCGPRDQYRPRQNPLSQAMPLPQPGRGEEQVRAAASYRQVEDRAGEDRPGERGDRGGRGRAAQRSGGRRTSVGERHRQHLPAAQFGAPPTVTGPMSPFGSPMRGP